MNLLSPQLQSKFHEDKALKGSSIISSTAPHTHIHTQGIRLVFVQRQDRADETEEQAWAQSPLPSPARTRGL